MATYKERFRQSESVNLWNLSTFLTTESRNRIFGTA